MKRQLHLHQDHCHGSTRCQYMHPSCRHQCLLLIVVILVGYSISASTRFFDTATETNHKWSSRSLWSITQPATFTSTAPTKYYDDDYKYYDDDTTDHSSSASVIALATGYDLRTYQRFVGSLRRSGYRGHILLGLAPNPPPDIVDYLNSRNVTIHILSWVNCTYTRDASVSEDIFQKTKCASPYPDIKIRWSRYPLARDWLRACTTCTGPVLITDARDVVFQRNPFGPGSPMVNSLQVFEEHATMTTNNWLTRRPIRLCKNIILPRQPMLCSGTTIGPRDIIDEYLELMYREMKVWIADPQCRFNMNGDDQSIHNYLYYTGQFPAGTRSIPHRQGGIVNTVGHFAARLYHEHIAPQLALPQETSRMIQYPGATRLSWIGTEYGVTNEQGLFIELDGSISRVVHQWDRFGSPYSRWLHQQEWIRDSAVQSNSRNGPARIDDGSNHKALV
jgi:hypothetical protein